MSEKILEIERSADNELVIRLRRPKLGLMRDDTAEHLRTARKELLLAVRGVIDAAIRCTEEEEKARGEGRKKIEVQ